MNLKSNIMRKVIYHKKNETYFIPKKIPHNVKNIGQEDLLVLEICFDNFVDTDTIRVLDRYWRT